MRWSWATVVLVGVVGTPAAAQNFSPLDSPPRARAESPWPDDPPCDNPAWCGPHGTCYSERGQPKCLCQEGFVVVDGACVASARRPEPDWVARRSLDLGARVVAIAMAERNRGPREVGSERTTFPFALSRYVARAELWCTDFAMWVYAVAGVPLTGGSDGGWHVGSNFAARAWFKRHRLWVSSHSPVYAYFRPRPGDWVRVHNPRGGHSGIVRSVEGDTLYTVEGNVGNRVRVRRYEHYRRNRRIDGFGIVAMPNARRRVLASFAVP